MLKMECSGCGGRLIEQGRFLICENCGTKFAIGKDDEGNPFTYQPVEKKEIDCGKVAKRATEIQVNKIVVKEIKLRDTIERDVYSESLNIEHHENVRLIVTFIASEECSTCTCQIG